MDGKGVPNWVFALDGEDLEFIKKFVMNSGSLKDIAKVYDVSYPTVRIRLDGLIQKVMVNDVVENEDFVKFIRGLSIDERISLDDAKLIIEKYKREKEEVK